MLRGTLLLLLGHGRGAAVAVVERTELLLQVLLQVVDPRVVSRHERALVRLKFLLLPCAALAACKKSHA